MDNGFIASRYARALFKYCESADCLQQTYGEMQMFEQSYKEVPRLQAVLNSPVVKSVDKEKVLLTATGHEAGDVMKRFIHLVSEKKRESYFYQMSLKFQEFYRLKENIILTEITTAVPVSNQLESRLTPLLNQRFKGEYKYIYKVNPDILGGLIIKIESLEADASIRRQLKKIEKSLYSS